MTDAQELAYRRRVDAEMARKYTGWKPLVFWYAAWAGLLIFGAVSLISQKSPGAGLVALGLAAGAAWYARYLYRGGRRRVWFFIF